MAISFISQASGIDSIATMPSHQAGDLLIFYAFLDGTASPPSMPGDCTNIGTNTRFNTGARVAYKIAASGSETSGTWTSATALLVHVYRGTKRPGKSHLNNGTGTLLLYSINSQTFDDAAGSAWAVGFGGHRSTNGSMVTPPSGMTNRSFYGDTVNKATGHDTAGAVSSWSDQSVEVGGAANGWICSVVELVPFETYTPSLFTNTNTIHAPVLALKYYATAPLVTRSHTIYAPVVSLIPAESYIYRNLSVFYLPVVALKYYISGALLTRAHTINVPFVTQEYHLSAPLITNSSQIFAPVVETFNYIIPELFINQSVIFTHKVKIINYLFTPIIERQHDIYEPVVSFGVFTIGASLHTNSSQIHAPVVALKYYAAAPLVTRSHAIYSPVVSLVTRIFVAMHINQHVFFSASASIGAAPVLWRNVFIIHDNIANNYSTLATTSEAAGFSKFNMVVDKKPYSWRSTTRTDQIIAITWAAAKTLNSVALAFTNLTAGATISVQCYTNAADSLPFFTSDIRTLMYSKPTPRGFASQNYASHAFGGGSYLSVFFEPVSVKKIKINISDINNLDSFLAIGRLIIGDAFVPTYNAEYGADIGVEDGSIKIETESGSTIVNRKPIERSLLFSLPALIDAEKLRSLTIQKSGIVSPVFVSLLPGKFDEADHEEQAAQIYGLIESSNTAFSFFEHYKSSFKIKEL